MKGYVSEPKYSMPVSYTHLNFKEERPKRSRITSTIRSYSGEPVVAYFSRFLFSSPSNSLITRRVINSRSPLEAVKPTNGQLYINGGHAIRIDVYKRQDTYPYADYDAMSNWMKELNEEYPNYNTVGETWVTEPAYTAWWQKDSKLSAPKNSNLKTVMDFSFFDKINTAKNEQTETWFKGLDRVYNSFVYDFLYPNPASVLAFIENHDTDRFLGDGDNLPMLKQASTLLLTTRRIPQLYYGTEIMMNGVKSKSDGYVRKDFPGGCLLYTSQLQTKKLTNPAKKHGNIPL